jgi:hypothetical protein
MTFPAVAALVLLLEPESAIAFPPLASTITVAPVTIDVVSLCLLNIVGVRVMVVHPLHRWLVVDPTMRRAPWTSV